MLPNKSVSPMKWMLSTTGHPQVVRMNVATGSTLLSVLTSQC